MHILHVVGARPNFIKVSPVMKALRKIEDIRQTLVHTGQHYDSNMSEVFFDQLGIPRPDINLEVGSGSHAQQTAQIMSRFEQIVLGKNFDLVLVYGDVNSTVASGLVCTKLGIPVGHVEAGLRSFDRRMPEEINRLITDQIADLLFTPSIDGNNNLLHEGIGEDKIYLVGNVMIDTLVHLLPKADDKILNKIPEFEYNSLTSACVPYALVTLHRPSNVDDPSMLARIIIALNKISHEMLVIFPIHPRTHKRLLDLKVEINTHHFKLIDPVGYLQFLALQQRATVVITDSGGIQEETTFLGVPCLTVRENTERPVTITKGTNELVGKDMDRLRVEVERILSGNGKKGSVPPLWDGKASERIAGVIEKWWRESI